MRRARGSDQGLWPWIEAFRVGDNFVVQADLPGMQADDIIVELRETDVIISGERVRSARADGQTDQQERSFGPFRRRVRLPEGVGRETVRATVERKPDSPAARRGAAAQVQLNASRPRAADGHALQTDADRARVVDSLANANDPGCSPSELATSPPALRTPSVHRSQWGQMAS